MLIKRDPAFFTGVTSELPVRLTRSPPSPRSPAGGPCEAQGPWRLPTNPMMAGA